MRTEARTNRAGKDATGGQAEGRAPEGRKKRESEDGKEQSRRREVGKTRSMEDGGDEEEVDFNAGAVDSRSFTDVMTESYQTNVDRRGNADHLLQDAHNLYFSHMPRMMSTDFRFQVGEIAYTKWRGELNIVVVHFVSQKLVTSIVDPKKPAKRADGSSEGREKSQANPHRGQAGKKTEDKSGGSGQGGAKDDKKEGAKNKADGDGAESDEASNAGSDGAESERSEGGKESVGGKQGKSAAGLVPDSHGDKNVKLFKDASSHKLYADSNAMRALPVRVDKDTPPDVVAYEAEVGKGGEERKPSKAVVKRYFIPMYFVTFPGYKKRCAKTFRFWVKEKDLIKFNSVRQVAGRGNKAVVAAPGEREDDAAQAWAEREIEDINEYVYNVVYNVYKGNPTHAKFKRAPDLLPWSLPKPLQQLVLDQQNRMVKLAEEKVNFYSIGVAEMFSVAPLSERLSAYSLVQNFKYILIVMVTLIKNKGGRAPTSKCKVGASPLAKARGVQGVLVDELNVPSLRFMEQIDCSVSADITSQQFHEIYVNNIYWLDVYLVYLDKLFLHSHCHNAAEHEFLYMLAHSKGRPLSRILGLEHLARIFCYPVMYTTLLQRVQRQGAPFEAYMPITQLLLQYMAFVAADYMHNQKYLPSHLESGLFKVSHLNVS
ncbi:killing trait family protein, putative [Babesia caballi]|uniref:Killing trait family protein, putative n=1 Tax=Babesia caballi TaxID=5871 RepID=A0AAV4LUQ9_BABCB|nr:killing trait family protein, putative [Babesia caballi]